MAWRFVAECVACERGAFLMLLCISALGGKASKERNENHEARST